jgi:hypothetical protein
MTGDEQYEEAQRLVHEAIGLMVDDDEMVMSWVLTIDVGGPDGRRYLAHRAGGGFDGTESPMAWTALGMLRASARLAEDQVVANSGPVDKDDPPSSD